METEEESSERMQRELVEMQQLVESCIGADGQIYCQRCGGVAQPAGVCKGVLACEPCLSKLQQSGAFS